MTKINPKAKHTVLVQGRKQAPPRYSRQSADRYELLGRLWECEEDEKHTRPLMQSLPSERWPMCANKENPCGTSVRATYREE